VVTRVVWLSKTFVALSTNLLSPISTKIVPLLLFMWCLLLYFDWPPWLIVVYFNFNMGERKYHIYTSTTYLNHLLATRMQHTMAMVLLFYKTTTMVALELCTSNVRVACTARRTDGWLLHLLYNFASRYTTFVNDMQRIPFVDDDRCPYIPSTFNPQMFNTSRTRKRKHNLTTLFCKDIVCPTY